MTNQPAERDETITTLTNQLAERDATIKTLTNQLEERDTTIKTLMQQLKEALHKVVRHFSDTLSHQRLSPLFSGTFLTRCRISVSHLVSGTFNFTEF